MSLLSDLGTKIGTKLKELQTAINGKLDTTGGTVTDDVIIQKNGSTASTGNGDVVNSATLKFVDTSNNQNVELVHDPFDGSVGIPGYTGYGLRLRQTSDNSQPELKADLFVEGDVYVNNTEKVLTTSSGGNSSVASLQLSGSQNTYTTPVNGLVPFNYITGGEMIGWDTNTYRFTAAVAGNYLISTYGLVQTAQNFELQILKNGSIKTRFYSSGTRVAGGSALVTLAVGDYISISSSVSVYLHSTSPYSGLTIIHQP